MAVDFVVRTADRQTRRQVRTVKGDVQPITVDFSPWADDNGAVTGATWSIKTGNAAISSDSVASSVASALLTTAQQGDSIIEVKGTGATHTKVLRIHVQTRDERLEYFTDYRYDG